MPTQDNIAWFAFGYVFAHALSWLLVTFRRRMAMRRLIAESNRLREEFQARVADAELCEYTVDPGVDLRDVLEASGVTLEDIDKLNMGQWRWEPGEKVQLPRAACLYLLKKGNPDGTESTGR